MPLNRKIPYACVAGLALILAWSMLARPTLLLELNSDTLYIDDFWASLFDGRGWRAWNLPPNPSFFPDVALYALSTLAGADWGMRHAVYALLQGAMLGWGLALCGRRYFGLPWPEALAASLAGLTLYILLLSPASGLGDLFQPSHHGSSMAMLLGMLAFFPRSSALLKPWEFAAWALAAALACYSDRSILAWAFVPALVMMAVEGSWRWSWILAVLAALEAASLANAALERGGGPRISYPLLSYFAAHMLPMALAGLQSVARVFAQAKALGCLGLAWLVWACARWKAPLAWFTLASAASTLVLAVLMGGLAGRHFYPLYFLPCGFIPMALLQRQRAAFLALALLAGASLAGLCAAAGGPWGPRLRSPYPDEVAGLESALAAPRAVSGYADYWHCRRTRMLSRRGLWLDPVDSGLAGKRGLVGYAFISNGCSRPGPHGYVIVDGLGAPGVEKAFGPPALRRRIGSWEVWSYGPSRDLELRLPGP
jgi:hypothetical protein